MSTEPNLPAVGSEWRANDGRLMRVDEWVKPTSYPLDDYWARLTVLNPQKGMKRTSTMQLRQFGKFLQPVEASNG